MFGRFANTHRRLIAIAEERNLPRLTLMVGWWSTDVTVGSIPRLVACYICCVISVLRCIAQVSASPEIPFPHAAMVTPAASTPWLQPLISALSLLGPIAIGTGAAKNEKKRKKTKKTQTKQCLDTGGTDTIESIIDTCGVDVAPHFVTPVWESCAKVVGTSKSGRATDQNEDRRHLHLADAQLFANGKNKDGGCL